MLNDKLAEVQRVIGQLCLDYTRVLNSTDFNDAESLRKLMDWEKTNLRVIRSGQIAMAEVERHLQEAAGECLAFLGEM